MLRRNLNSDFVGGAYVFPGGAVDEADRHSDLERGLRGPHRRARRASRSASTRGGLAFWVAAIRECFEEAGVLLAYDARRRADRASATPSRRRRFERHREAVDTASGGSSTSAREERPAPGRRPHALLQPLDHARRRAPPLRHPLLRRRGTRGADAAARRPRDDRQPAGSGRRTRSSSTGAASSTSSSRRSAASRPSPASSAAPTCWRLPRQPATCRRILPRISPTAHGVRILLPGDAGYDEPSTPWLLPTGAGAPAASRVPRGAAID